MDPRVKPEDDEGRNFLHPGPDTVARKIGVYALADLLPLR